MSGHPGQIAGAAEPRVAESIPATNVPCVHASLVTSEQRTLDYPEASRMNALRHRPLADALQGHIDAAAAPTVKQRLAAMVQRVSLMA
jgi:hypothetical protein